MKRVKKETNFEFFEGHQRRAEQRYQRTQSRLNRAAVAWALHYETKWGDNFNGDGMSLASKLLRAVRARLTPASSGGARPSARK